jgi:hypothetical protein
MCAAVTRPNIGAMTYSELLDRSEFLKRAAALGLVAAGANALDPITASAAAGSRGGLRHRGITYDTGIDHFGESSRLRWTRAQMEGEIGAIRDRLHCNAVSVAGTHVPRLVQTAEAVLERGMHVMIQPRNYDRPQTEILEHLVRTVQDAERLRLRHPGRVTLIVGCEHSLFTPGIVPGDDFLERIAYLGRGKIDFEALRRRLNAFLGQAAAVARAHFGGDVTYAAGIFEQVDWTPFDIVGVNYYEFHRSRSGHARELAPYRRWNKPILICEFGCCTYKGAPQRGGTGYDIVDYDKVPPELIGKPVRSEATQARYIAEMLDVFESQDLLGAFVYTFISPDAPSSKTPKHNMDTAAFSVVKVILENERDLGSKYRWETKRAFHAIARHNRSHARR